MRAPSLAALLAITVAATGTADAANRKVQVPNRYDGNWSIEVITESGICDRAYRYGVRIERGAATYPGDDFAISGRVTNAGAVNATISNGAASANVVGRLNRQGLGNGTWRTEGGPDCRGRWNAERRG